MVNRTIDWVVAPAEGWPWPVITTSTAGSRGDTSFARRVLLRGPAPLLSVR